MVESSQHSRTESILSIEADYTPFVNFAMQQNAVPLLRMLTVTNSSDKQVTDVSVRVRSDPPVVTEKIMRLDSIAPRAKHTFPAPALTHQRDLLRKQSEREEGYLWIEVTSDEFAPERKQFPLSVLAYNEWYGVSLQPEIIAAHVLPNDPAVECILAEASKILLEKTQDGSLSGYQSGDPRRAYTQAAAIYFATARQKIGYINPPASFEDTGQKIRTPEHVLKRKLGSCLDTTALLAACFEQAGLRPVIVLVEGHAFPGVWLVDKSFDDTVTRHDSILLNRIGLNEFIVVESTGIAKTPPFGFKMALDQANNQLQSGTRFHFAVDIKSARKLGIRPLSLTGDVEAPDDEGISPEGYDLTPIEDLSVPEGVAEAGTVAPKQPTREQESPADRLARWKNSLLDLSLRNRLLNFKDSKKSIPLLCPNIAGLEDALAANEAFRVRSKPKTWDTSDPRDAGLHREQTGGDALAEYLREEMSQKRLHADITDRELAARLTQIERAARLGLEEGGANTLFLALGSLIWTEDKNSDVERRAPILLIPMSIERQSVREGFRIQRIDEESRINISLLQKLKMDFGIVIDGLDPLPEDESGLDVPKILRIIRKAVKREPHWKVVESASLTILTFSRFLMWLDLEANAEELKKNEVVRHLVESANEPFNPGETFPRLETLDDQYQPSGTFCPLHADSSQLRAVYAAAEGRTFVLQGPPGTGKSQTITNLIAHCLTIEKRVLFVAQKRAALNVVHKRLSDIGLGAFCLELHSNKATKESFRAQLREALSVAGSGSSGHWEAQTSRLAEKRQTLNEYVRDLHEPRAFGKSAYWIISRLIGFSGEPKVVLDLCDANGRTHEEFERMRSVVREMAEAARVSGNPAGHPLGAVRLSEWAYGIEDDVNTAIQAAEEAYRNLKAAASQTLPDLGIGVDEASISELRLASELMALLATTPGSVTQAILSEPDWHRIKSELTEWIDVGRGCSEKRALLLTSYTEGILSLDLQALIETLRTRKDAWFWKKWRMRSAVLKAVRPVRKDGKKPQDLTALEEELGQALTVVKESARLESKGEFLSRCFGSSWQGTYSQWDTLQQIVHWTDMFRKIIDRAPGADMEAKLKTRGTWMRLATEGRVLFDPDAPAAQQARVFEAALKDFENRQALLGSMLQLDAQAAWGEETIGGMFETIQKTLRNLAANLPRLREWTVYQGSRAEVTELHLTELADALDRGEISVHQLESVFEHSFADWWARNILKSIPSLAGFIGERHDMKIREFRKYEASIADLTRKETFARIASRMPRVATGIRTPASSEAGLLQRFAQGGRKTIRRIFRECPNALAKYKPCVLMSPLSVAQFIGADFPKFDIVVFDEASQMPTYDAIGAIARGNQLLVVGDSRQLPPTSFFERQKGDEEYSEDDLPEELESILEEAEAAGIEPLRLEWHYRSRHESLIAFSNRQYYDNRLNTFPAALAEHPNLGVRWCEVPDGVYDYGKSRTNRKEAQTVVDEIVKRLRDPKQQHNSLGVVTFSQAQQGLVEDLLDVARGKYPEIDPYFTTVSEPVFVKNLETVQGDERDVILFSICYGPDAAGITRMNFGPLNNKGGERRLNVAITRARRQLLVFSRLVPEQIDLSRTQAAGVHHLKVFLDYAKRGPVAFAEEVSQTTGEIESYFEKSVLDELTKKGWRVDAQVGCSGYRIDLAVRDPEAPGRYLLGIECDGANYHSAKSARDRDRLRQAVLEGLGWQLHRIWSTDWWLQRPKQIAKLEEALRVSKQKFNATDEVDLSPPANVPTTSVQIDNPEKQDMNLRFAKDATVIRSKSNEPIPVIAKLPRQSNYLIYKPLIDKTFQGELYDPKNARTVRDLVKSIVDTEAPLLFDALCSEVASFWGLKRTGNRIKAVVKDAVKQNGHLLRRSGKREFIWTKELAEKPYDRFRIPSENDSKARTAEEICPEEVANAATQVLTMHISINHEDLMRETAKIFGIMRLGVNVKAAFEEGIDLMKKKGMCRVEEGNLVKP